MHPNPTKGTCAKFCVKKQKTIDDSVMATIETKNKRFRAKAEGGTSSNLA
jgi:hypothetical protein